MEFNRFQASDSVTHKYEILSSQYFSILYHIFYIINCGGNLHPIQRTPYTRVRTCTRSYTQTSFLLCNVGFA